MRKKILVCFAIAFCFGMVSCKNKHAEGTTIDSTATVYDATQNKVNTSSSETKEMTSFETEDTDEHELFNPEVNELVGLIATTRDKSNYEKMYSYRTMLKRSPEVRGEWNRTNVHSSLSSLINIYSVTNEGFDFSTQSFYYSHSGCLDGYAFWVTENIAICKFEDTEIHNTIHYVLFV